MARPRPGTAAPGRPRVVQPGEALEHPLAVVRGDARAVVGDDEDGVAVGVLRPGSTVTRVPRMADGVVERGCRPARSSCARSPGTWTGRTPRGVDRAARRPRGARRPPSRRRRRGPPAPAARGQRTRRRRGPAGAGRRPAAAAPTVSASTLAAVAAGSAEPGWAASTSSSARIRASGLRSSWDGVGDEAALLLGRRLEPAEHRVHRAREPADLSRRVRLGHPPVEAGRGDRVHPGADVLDRAQRPPDRPPDDAGQHGAGQRHGDDERAGQRRGAVARRRRGCPRPAPWSPSTSRSSSRAASPSAVPRCVGVRPAASRGSALLQARRRPRAGCRRRRAPRRRRPRTAGRRRGPARPASQSRRHRVGLLVEVSRPRVSAGRPAGRAPGRRRPAAEHGEHREGGDRGHAGPQGRRDDAGRADAGASRRADPVAGAADGLDGARAERLVELAPQPGDVHLDDVGVTLELVVPDPGEDLLLGHHRPGPAHEVDQQVELPGGERDLRAAPVDPPGAEVQRAGRRP